MTLFHNKWYTLAALEYEFYSFESPKSKAFAGGAFYEVIIRKIIFHLWIYQGVSRTSKSHRKCWQKDIRKCKIRRRLRQRQHLKARKLLVEKRKILMLHVHFFAVLHKTTSRNHQILGFDANVWIWNWTIHFPIYFKSSYRIGHPYCIVFFPKDSQSRELLKTLSLYLRNINE